MPSLVNSNSELGSNASLSLFSTIVNSFTASCTKAATPELNSSFSIILDKSVICFSKGPVSLVVSCCCRER